ncbi:triggering receptor expressed on myeloid cells 1-like [Cynocephalus volans]|uniref:triggering receptor expressed on myeloid cells 1-like n=1 Tax=Cynocephalus volans TaxID=110931 RepID=UPI002FCA7E20
MRKARLWGLLWTLFVSELHKTAESMEEKYVLAEGQTLTLICPFNNGKYMHSKKAWQRLTEGGEIRTLVHTEETSGKPSQVQVGKYMLKDVPTESVLHVTMTNLQVEDSGLYHCVIYHPPREPEILFHPVRLVVTKNHSDTPASDESSTQNLAQITTTITTTSKLYTKPSLITKTSPMSTAVISSPGPRDVTNVVDVFRIPVFSIVVPVACCLLTKSLVFTVLFAVMQRSIGA